MSTMQTSQVMSDKYYVYRICVSAAVSNLEVLSYNPGRDTFYTAYGFQRSSLPIRQSWNSTTDIPLNPFQSVNRLVNRRHYSLDDQSVIMQHCNSAEGFVTFRCVRLRHFRGGGERDNITIIMSQASVSLRVGTGSLFVCKSQLCSQLFSARNCAMLGQNKVFKQRLTPSGHRCDEELLLMSKYGAEDSLCGLVVRVPGYTTEMYCASCEVRTEFIYVM
jgi:hypothetical protein